MPYLYCKRNLTVAEREEEGKKREESRLLDVHELVEDEITGR